MTGSATGPGLQALQKLSCFTALPFADSCVKIEVLMDETVCRLPSGRVGFTWTGGKKMDLGVVIGLAAFGVMALIGVLMGIIAAVSTVSGIDTRDNDGD